MPELDSAKAFQTKYAVWLNDESKKVKFTLYLSDAEMEHVYGLMKQIDPRVEDAFIYERKFWNYNWFMREKIKWNEPALRWEVFQLKYFNWLRQQVKTYPKIQWFVEDIKPFYELACSKAGVSPDNKLNYEAKFWVYKYILTELEKNPSSFTTPEEKTDLKRVMEKIYQTTAVPLGGIFEGIGNVGKYLPFLILGYFFWSSKSGKK